MTKLTALKVRSTKLTPGRYGDGNGLYLLVSKSGGKSWMLRTIVETHTGKKRQDIGLGSADLTTLEEARDLSRKLRKAARSGLDPRAVRDHRDEAKPTFEAAARACHAAKAPGWSDKNAAAWVSSLELHVFPAIGSIGVDKLTDRDVAAVLAPSWTEKPSLARKLRSRVGMVLNFAKASGWRLTGAPGRELSLLLPKRAEEGNFASMPYSDVPGFFTSISSKTDTPARLALLFQILTGARHGEVRGSYWSQFDLDAGEWHRPASLMKSGKPHMVTLSPEAIAIVKRAQRLRTVAGDCLAFPNSKGTELSDSAIGKIVRPTGYTAHGFRSSFRTWAAEQMPSVPEAVAEAALAHAIPDQVIRSYNRAKFIEKRRELLNAWGAFVQGRENVLRLVG